jgi:hypothetical protein
MKKPPGEIDWESAAVLTAVILAAWVAFSAVILSTRLAASGCEIPPMEWKATYPQ